MAQRSNISRFSEIIETWEARRKSLLGSWKIEVESGNVIEAEGDDTVVKRRIDKLSYGAILDCLKASYDCGDCTVCMCNYLYDENDKQIPCSKANRELYRVLVENCGCWIDDIDNAKKLSKLLEQPQEEIPVKEVQKNLHTEPFYEQTRNFMKKSGYKKCYMCGSELE